MLFFFSNNTMKVSVNVNNILKILIMIIVNMCLTTENTKLIIFVDLPK